MFTFNWQHIITTKNGYAGTSHRIAKMRAGGAQSLPYRQDSRDVVNLMLTQNSSEWAPPTYAPPFSPAHPQFGASTYEFEFWSVNGMRSEEIVFRSVHLGNPPLQDNASFADGTTINAKAWYLRSGENPGSGKGVVEIDAFDTTSNDFILDDFVNVFPDSPENQNHRNLGILGYTANEDGSIPTADLPGPITIKAHDIEANQTRGYRFDYWLVIHSNGSPMPLVNDSVLTIDPGCGIKAYAIYRRFDHKGDSPIVIDQGQVVDTLRGYALYHNGIPFLQISPTGEVRPIPMGGDPAPDWRELAKMLLQAAKSLEKF